MCRSLVLHGFAGDSTGGKPNQEPPPSAGSSTSAATASAASSASSAATASTALRSVGAQVPVQGWLKANLLFNGKPPGGCLSKWFAVLECKIGALPMSSWRCVACPNGRFLNRGALSAATVPSKAETTVAIGCQLSRSARGAALEPFGSGEQPWGLGCHGPIRSTDRPPSHSFQRLARCSAHPGWRAPGTWMRRLRMGARMRAPGYA